MRPSASGTKRREQHQHEALKTKTPRHSSNVGALFCSVPDDALLSREIHPTIIGAEAFHGPVRDGKEWFHLAMVVRQRRTTGLLRSLRTPTRRSNSEEASFTRLPKAGGASCIAATLNASRTRQHGYRIKPHGQLVTVSLTPHSASTPVLSTSWSRTTL